MAKPLPGDGSSVNKIKVGVAVALLLAACVVGYLGMRSEGQLDTATSAILFVCPADNATLSLTPAGYEKMLNSGQVGPPEGAGPRTPGMFVRCPKCNKRTMVVATRCEKDGVVFVARTEDGNLAACPRCQWKPQEPQR